MYRLAIAILVTALSVAVMAATASASPTSQAGVPPGVKFVTTAPAHTTNQDKLGDGWTDTRTSTDVRQNMVGCQGVPSPCGRQTLWAKSSNNWGVIATMPKGNLSVLTYPDTQKLFEKEGTGAATPVSKFRAIRGHYAVQVPKRGDWEVAYDIWLDDWNIEVMIWLYNHGQTPAGDPIGNIHFYGQTWQVWRDSSKEPPYTIFPELNSTHGMIHIKSALYGLLHMHVLKPSQMRINDIELGEEICNTDGVPEAFTFTQDWLYTPGVAQ